MKAKLLITILLILLGTAIFASEDPFDAEEYVRKTQELNQLAERFKAETGFRGNVSYDLNRMCLGYYEGKFADIQITAEADTASFRTAFEQIMDKVLPYTFARREQLARTRITNMHGRIKTVYYQQVNGYRVEGAGKLSIAYESGRNAFAIGNGTVELPEVDVSAIISQEEAIRIANQEYFNSNSLTVKPWKVTLAFTNGKDHNNKDYYLCYNLYCGTVVCVDAVTGDIRYTWSRVRVHSISALIKGDVYEKVYTNLNPSPLGYKPLSSVSVSTDSFIGNSDYDGVVIITDSTLVGLSAKLAESPCFYVTVYPDSTNAKTADQYHLGYTPMEIWFDDDSCYTPNVYYHACHQRTKLEEMFNRPYSPNDVLFGLAIVSGDTNMGSGGYFDPVSNKIHLSNSAGKLSHTVRHEMSHCHLYEIVGDYFNTYSSPGSSRNYWAMDEAFAVYFPCAVIEEPDCIYGDPLEITSLLSNNNHVSNISNIFNGNTMVTEDYYSSYYCRYPLASAWWSLRSNPLFPNSVQGVCGGDTLLVNSLEKVGEQIPQNSAYRYKPRYFYNILMKQVDEDNNPYPLNLKQIAIDEAYRSRGFHFTPQVISAGVPNPPDGKDKNMFRLCDSLYVKVTNCPQNTPLTVYVVEDQDYTDGMHISALNTIICQVSGTSNNDGVWYSSTPVMTTTTVGDFDILVDIGNNGVLHYGYTAANIRDGFDGLEGPGFTVYDDGITIVLMGSERNSSPCSK